MVVKPLFASLVLIFLMTSSGCGGCQSSSPAPQSEAKPEVKSGAPAPARRAAPAPVAQPAEPEPDCFVIVDAENDFGGPPLKVRFETEVDCTAAPVTYAWDFGDGSKGGNEASPTHVYEKPGDYVAIVRVTSPDGGESDDEIDITVDEMFED